MRQEKYVYLAVPQEAWNLLSETLEMDSHAGNFDPGLRREISDALEQLSYLTLLARVESEHRPQALYLLEDD